MDRAATAPMLFVVVAHARLSFSSLVVGLEAVRLAVSRAILAEGEPLSPSSLRMLDTLGDAEAWDADPGQAWARWTWNLAHLDGFVVVQRVTEWPANLPAHSNNERMADGRE